MNLTEILKDRGMTDAELARQLRCVQSTVYHWKAGTYMPRLEYVKKICEILSCSADDLFGIQVEKPTRLNRALSVSLYQAVTKGGQYDSQYIHQIASRVRIAKGGKLTETERWFRQMAEAVYQVEILLKPKKQDAKSDNSYQLRLF